MSNTVTRQSLVAFACLIAHPACGGEHTPGYLGISVVDRIEQKGVGVTEVFAATPAAEAGLLAKDVIIAIDAFPVVDVNSFFERLANVPPGTSISLVILRNGLTLTKVATLDECPKFSKWLSQTKPPRVTGGTGRSMGGASVIGGITNGGNEIIESGTLLIDGYFQQEWSGLLALTLDRRDGHSAMEVTGKVVLAGILYLEVSNISPRAGDKFEIIRNAESINGEFGKLMLPSLAEGLRWKIVYDNVGMGIDLDGDEKHDVTLVVGAVPKTIQLRHIPKRGRTIRCRAKLNP